MRRELAIFALCLAVPASAVAQDAYVPVGETHVRDAIKRIAIDQSAISPTERAQAQFAAQNCDMDSYSIQNRVGKSHVQVNLDCAEKGKFGFYLTFKDGLMEGAEAVPGGVELIIPPAPPKREGASQ
ncbi:hypothetical protein WAB17_11535 [Parerythrobacter aurantius]|uniref:hypothetical protein n=1 Tax=Parerythrobacter aurantius TaxID=3127706 RepID=UPI00324336A6